MGELRRDRGFSAALQPDLGRFRAGGLRLLRQAARRRPLPHHARRVAQERGLNPARSDGHRRAGLQRGRGPRDARGGQHVAQPGEDGPDRALRFLYLQRLDPPRPLGRGGMRLAFALPEAERVWENFLSQAPPPDQRQERQRGRLLPALGQALPLHDRDGCRQRDDRADAGAAGARDGGEPGRGHHPDAALHGAGHVAVPAHPAIFQPRLRRPVLAGLQHGADGLGLVLGPYTRSSAWPRSSSIATCRCCPCPIRASGTCSATTRSRRR